MIALTRSVPASIANCELTHLQREPINVERARQQHRAYEETLALLGYTIVHLPDTPQLPDSVFVEDTAVVTDEIAIITRPGAESRRPETDTVADVLRQYRPVVHIQEPGTLDGGDVLLVGRKFFVGKSDRTNEAGIEQLRMYLTPFGYSVDEVALNDCLHLKTAVTALDDTTVLLNPAWVTLPGFDAIEVDPQEAFAANVLLTPHGVMMSAAFPRTIERVRNHGIDVHPVDASELAKAEGGLTCCSLLLA